MILDELGVPAFQEISIFGSHLNDEVVFHFQALHVQRVAAGHSAPFALCKLRGVHRTDSLHLHGEKILAFAGRAACVPISVTNHIINTGLFCWIFGVFLSMSSSQVGNFSGFYMGLLGLWITNNLGIS